VTSKPRARKRKTARRPRTAVAGKPPSRNVLVIDVGGTSVKILATGQTEHRSFPSGPTMTPRRMVSEVKKLAAGWMHDLVSIGYPGPVLRGRPVSEPHNLGSGWVGFDFATAFGRPVQVINDAAMQALGSYKGGKMLFLGLGTGLGTAMIVDGVVEPMELGHLPYKKGTYEDYVGRAGLERFGNVAKLEALPPQCRAGDNSNAFHGGFRLWEDENAAPTSKNRPEKTR
jgi:polyphosphate glucokinase